MHFLTQKNRSMMLSLMKLWGEFVVVKIAIIVQKVFGYRYREGR